jgi:5-methylcytosine-specific restriction endonuclease McrA
MVSHLKKHTKLYLAYFSYDVSDFIPCEICNAQAIDIHHIECRGMGGTKEVENIDNLMAVCRSCHIKYGDKKEYKEFLKEVHNDYKYRGGN